MIGVGTTDTLKALKKQLLFFDEIAVVLGIDGTGDWDIRKKHPGLAADLDWLRHRGIVWAAKGNADAINVMVRSANLAEVRFDGDQILVSLPSHQASVAVARKGHRAEQTLRVSQLLDALFDICCQVECHTLERNSPVRAVSLHPPSTKVSMLRGLTVTPSDVLSVVLNSIPLPDESVSLERVVDFRSDPDSRARLVALRRWLETLSAGNATPQHCAQELEHLLHEYEDYMRLNKLKISIGTLETIITLGAQTAEDLVKFKWGNAAKALFSVSNRKIGLMEAERSAPGREIAYLVRARDAFRKT